MEHVTPAQLSLLAIYNPSLGRSDDTLHDQIAYYYSTKLAKARRSSRRSSTEPSEQQIKDEQNEKLRQIGLAQGIVEFAKAFSDGQSVDSVESEKSRTLMHEIEPGWWLLAIVDLTRIESRTVPEKGTSGSKGADSAAKSAETKIEYSAREVCPPALLLQHLLRAHSIFLLHHAPSLSDLYIRLTKPKFCSALERFWNKFVRDWEVLLHGNPAIDIYNGLKLAAGGELGIGVGEEEWGSGEREVLEGFISRTEGLVDIVVSRFGHAKQSSSSKDDDKWMGVAALPLASDGVVFSGIGKIARPSLKQISAWMEWLYKYGHAAYGAKDNPLSAWPKRRRKAPKRALPTVNGAQHDTEASISPVQAENSEHSNQTAQRMESPRPGSIPPPLVTANEPKVKRPSDQIQVNKVRQEGTPQPAKEAAYGVDSDTLLKYATFGIYGSSWGIPSKKQNTAGETETLQQENRREEDAAVAKVETAKQPMDAKADLDEKDLEDPDRGYFLIGLKGDLENEGATDEEDDSWTETADERLMIRTLYIERTNREEIVNEEHDPTRHMLEPYERLRVVVYIRRPFVFTFLFAISTDHLSLTSFYRSLHHQLGPLQGPLLLSTSPSRVQERLRDAVAPRTIIPSDSPQPIYDLVYDPATLTIHTTIPSIPDPGTAAAEGFATSSNEISWTRIEALNVHSQILSTYESTRRRVSELESTCKTSRGWWVVWMRLPGAVLPSAKATSFSSKSSSNHDTDSGPVSGGVQSESDNRRKYIETPMAYKEAVLIRKASDYVAQGGRKISLGFGGGSSAASREASGAGWGAGAGKLAEGIGVDARRYIESLLSLNR